jgi:hypothetical protein
MVDFAAMLSVSEEEAPVEPRELYGQLKKAAGYGYLRDVQAQVLTSWHDRRDEKDIVIKVNTGGGKTIDGLVILQSYINAGEGPALYVAPSKYLQAQVIAEAERIGIKTTTNVDGAAYLQSEAIGVVNVYELVNGRTKFSARRTSKRAPIGVVVIDDAHAALATTREKLSLTIPRSSAAFDRLLTLFEPDLRTQSIEGFLDVKDDRRGSPVRVPFWAWRSKLEDARTVLRKEIGDGKELYFDWPGVVDVLALCRPVFSNERLTITPYCPPIDHVTSFMEANHRVFLTATLADDSVLVTDFGADPECVSKPVTPISAGDIGERMILVPQEINPGLEAEDIRRSIVELSKQHNTVVLVPSDRWADTWRPYAEVVATKDTIEATVQRLKTDDNVGLVVLVNRYDGIDLPDSACRVLVIDGLPEAFSPEERLDALVANEDSSIDSRQVQRIEQGMGRGVRSNEDHCVVFLLGPRLAQLTVDPRTEPMFSPATREQLKLSRTVAAAMSNKPMSSIVQTAKQALNRDESWTKLARRALRNIEPEPGRVAPSAVARREAFVLAANADSSGARKRVAEAAETEMDALIGGTLLELQAIYADLTDPELGQQTLALAREKNTNVTKPREGLVYRPLDSHSHQVTTCVHRLTSRYTTPAQLRLDFEGVIEELVFDDLRVEQFEEAMRQVGFLIGLGSQRPEHDNNGGPDNLWALGEDTFWVIEAKTGVRSDAIGKRDMGQMQQSLSWVGHRYDPAATHVPVMVHRAEKIYGDATAISGLRIIREKGLGELAAALRSFSVALVTDDWRDASTVERLLKGHGLLAGQLEAFTVPQKGVKK